MEIVYDKGMYQEARSAQAAIDTVFGASPRIREANTRYYLKRNQKVRGFEPGARHPREPIVLLTREDVYIPKAKSHDDDYVFGYTPHASLFIISSARIKNNSEKRDRSLRISRSRYLARVSYIVLHELGHQLVKKVSHWKEYSVYNPATGYKTPTGWHCPKRRCVMAQDETLEALDRHIEGRYTHYFCKGCREEGFKTIR